MAEQQGQLVHTPADHRAGKRRTDQLPEELLPEPRRRVRLRSLGPLRFRLLQTLEPLIERFEPRVWWKLRDLAGFVLCHASPLCVAPAGNGAGKARNMAVNDPAKAPPLYEPDRR